jgi:hypothetical protein
LVNAAGSVILLYALPGHVGILGATLGGDVTNREATSAFLRSALGGGDCGAWLCRCSWGALDTIDSSFQGSQIGAHVFQSFEDGSG